MPRSASTVKGRTRGQSLGGTSWSIVPVLWVSRSEVQGDSGIDAGLKSPTHNKKILCIFSVNYYSFFLFSCPEVLSGIFHLKERISIWYTFPSPSLGVILTLECILDVTYILCLLYLSCISLFLCPFAYAGHSHPARRSKPFSSGHAASRWCCTVWEVPLNTNQVLRPQCLRG